MDSNVKDVVGAVAKELGLSEQIVKACIQTACISLREQMKEMSAPSILWPRFGKFTLNPNRCDEQTKAEYLEFKAKFKNLPYKGKKRHSPVKTIEQENEMILNDIDKLLDNLSTLVEE